MGAGKSTVGRIVAGRLGMPFVDTDALIEEGVGMSVLEIFEQQGEAYFRALESWVCKRVAGEGEQVVALGGGALLNHESNMALLDSGVMILLACRRDVLLSRLEGSALRGERPLLAGDFASRLDELMEARKEIYEKIDLALDTSELTPEEAADKVVAMYKRARPPVARRPLASSLGGNLYTAGSPFGATVVRVHSPSGEYKIYLGRRLLRNIGALLTPLKLGRRVVVATDSNVGALYGEKVVSTLVESEFDAHLVAMPAGEEHKSWESVELFVEGFLKAGLDRGGWVLA
jgi:shikimate kinase